MTQKAITRRQAIQTTVAALAAGLAFPINLLASGTNNPSLPDAAWNKIPCWHGFNLLEMFMNPWTNKDFVEDDFRIMRDWGCNFARLPMDYRNWIIDKDWRKIDETAIKRIDRAVELGRKYGIHIMINQHRAPGYTVAKPQENPLVWDSDEALDVCTQHWTMFAKRYAGIPSSHVSFNLFNEPSNVEMDKFMKVHRHLVNSIRAIDPNRLIICDGMSWGRLPVEELAELKVGQSTRGYNPMSVSHYKASWVGAQKWSEPSWPDQSAQGMLYIPNKGGVKPENLGPMTIDGPFDKPTTLRLKLSQVSSRADLVVDADGQTVLKRSFKPGPGEGEWSDVVYQEQWKTYQNLYELNLEAAIPAGTKQVVVHLTGGDWVSFSELGAKPNGESETVLSLRNEWGEKPSQLGWSKAADGRRVFTGGQLKDRKWLYEDIVKPWESLRKYGQCVVVGEFGAYNKTPHDVVLRWMEDMLINWKEQGWGWAQWNLRGSIGVIDSGREDVQYESFCGHQLDRKMLDLLQKYM